MISLRGADRIPFRMVIAATAFGLALAPRLPAELAIHFGASGTPDNYVPRIVALFSVPVISLATIAVVRGAARLDPPTDPRSIDTLVVGTTATLSTLHLLVHAWNVGYAVPMSLVAVGAVVWMLALAGWVVLRETTA